MKMIAGRRLLGLREQVAHARGADADEQLHELGRGDREERHGRLTRQRPGEQRLARAGRTREQHPARDPAAEAAVLVGVLEEVDDLHQLRLRLVDSRHVAEIDPLLSRLDPPRSRAPERRDPPAHRPRGAPDQEHEQPDEQQRWQQAEEQRREHRPALVRRLRVHHHALLREQLVEPIRVRERRNLGVEVRRRLLVLVVRRVAQRPPQLPLHRRTLGGDLLDVARPDLLQEHRPVGDPHALLLAAREQRDDPDVEYQHEQQEPDRKPPAGPLGARRPALRSRGRPGRDRSASRAGGGDRRRGDRAAAAPTRDRLRSRLREPRLQQSRIDRRARGC